MPVATRFLTANGLRLCVGVQGQGPRLLFIGGTGWDLRKPNTPLESPLTKGFRVALYDQRGMGRTDKPDGPYSMRGYAEDARYLLDALGWGTVHIVGYSFGGMVAQEFAIRFPERVDRLVLAASTAGGAGGASFPIHEFVDLPPYERAKRGLEIANKRFDAAFQNTYPEAADKLIKARAASQTRFIEEPGARRGLRLQLAARAAHDCFDRLAGISAQTLVLAGEDDGQAPVPYQRAMAQQIPNAQFETVEGAHDFLFENEQGYDRIKAFLAAE